MTPGYERWFLSNLALFGLTIAWAHLVISCGQTLMHRWLGHQRLGGRFFRNQINFGLCEGHLASAAYRGTDGNNTPFLLLPTILVEGVLFSVLSFNLSAVMAPASAASFYAHVFIDKEYHVEGSHLEGFAWLKRKRQLHFVHHLHGTATSP